MSEHKYITIKGAREHNLKNIDIKIPRDQFVVLTGLSGSGKSSLAFDTIYAEGQRKYMESLSSYARQFLGLADKPDIDSIEGLSPSISIDQKSTNRNPRSTVGTVTEIYDYLRLLYARIGIPHCPKCGKEIARQTVDQMVDEIMELPAGTKFQLLAPVVRGRKGEHVKLLQQAKKSGYVRVIVDDSMYDLSEEIKLDKNKKHNIDIVVDRLAVKEGIESRLTDSIETVLKLAEGLVKVDVIGGETMLFSDSFSCPDCGISIEEIEPRSFSFNNPFGACPCCTGLGFKTEFDIDLIIPDDNLTLNEGAIAVPGWQSSGDKKSYAHACLEALAEEYKFSLDVPFKDLPEEAKHVILYGTEGEKIYVHYKSAYNGKDAFYANYEGLLRNLQRRYRETTAESVKQDYETYMTVTPCEVCHGKRLKPESLAVTIGGKNIADVTDLSVVALHDFISKLELTDRQKMIGAQVLKEIQARLGFMINVGLDYLTLSRATGTLSGGEAQRIRLATQIGSGLVGVAYILDEPSIGLHQRDNDKLIAALKRLRDLGNTLLVVEHDEDTMLAADHVIDIGPGAGANGGEVVAQGTAEEIMQCPESITGAYLSGRIKIPVPEERRTPTGYIEVLGARQNNLKNIDVKFPLGVMTCVTGVSGSGKSSLVNEILYKHLARTLNRAKVKPGKHDDITGLNQLDKIINIDQSPIGRSPRSNPATYTGVFDLIRDLFANTKDAKAMGYTKGRFSFNVAGGRCEACRGDGIIKIEMHFRLATQIGSGLVGVAYILDEPSIGLHQRDNDKLIAALKRLRDLGNTLLVVEHDEDTMLAADHVIDIGPGAGANGGEVVAQGTAEEIMQCPESITGAYLSGRIKIPVPEERRTPTGYIEVLGARQNNLKNIDVKFPLGVMTCVTGVSGSGKSSLVNEILYKHLARTLNRAKVKPGKHDDITGLNQLDKIINIDQSPIGRSPRSNPATYTGVFDLIRDLFANTKDAKAMGYTKGRFSFNVAGGRCEACRGDGIIKIEMHFLADVYVPCEVCHGKRYNRETLEVKYKGKSIYDVLDMTVDEACEFFAHVPSVLRKISTLQEVGLGYIKLGQPSTTLSGGEAQRIKLATELSRRSTGRTIYVLDEPTTGLHFADVHRLVDILRRLCEGGNTVVVIEHNLDVIKTADYIIDIGPEGGEGGGTVVATGTPEEIAKCKKSYTGQYLKKYLKK